MFKLIGDDLPEIPTLDLNLAPAIRVFDGEEPYSLPPLVRFSPFAGRGTPDNAEEISLENPDYAGYLFVVTPGFEIHSISSLSSSSWDFASASRPLNAGLGNFWVYNNSIYILGELGQLGIADDLTVKAVASANIGIANASRNFLIDLTAWGSVTISQVLVNDILFTPAVNPLSPQTKEFKVTGSTLTLYCDAATSPVNFAIAQIVVEKQIAAPIAPSASIAIFDFSDQDAFYLDAISYLGISFAPPQNAWAPLPGEFFWKEPRATLFMNPSQRLTPKRSIFDVEPGIQAIGFLTYPAGGA